ncbi:DUF1107 domain-containing protein [Vibrio sp. CAU 1672]|uniref:DUF1107 domain-containing protein n=1 Tax=Vibrio sp. CAU 1672 TaxID=3032594 RepID=UPI0023DC0C92|nr:DUF1107 domain-containing protein [Vibrio sp. CAU 1672]MDF2153202.1 DUF1107 domain-containing protein [Vibrio sp. CAU 1672]
MLREFAVYRPHQVARFVKTWFKGTFAIDGIGEFRFDNGKVLLPDINDAKQLSVFKEVNQLIATLAV